jgi:hypothetical protein
MLSNYPDYLLITEANRISSRNPVATYEHETIRMELQFYDYELLSRQPPPREPEYDQDGNRIISEMIGYSDEGEEVWTSKQNH